jgi:Galactose oxidase, central domain/Kelch motif
MSTARAAHTATLLQSREVLIAGGSNDVALAEVYEPASGTFTPSGPMAAGKYDLTATLLPSGLVLVAGGNDLNSIPFSNAELYDPASRTFSSAGAMTEERYLDSATLLPNGKVLIVGGWGGDLGVSTGLPLSSAELYDPGTGTFIATGAMAAGRWNHTATLLPSGSVLVVGGKTDDFGVFSSAELYDPASGTFTSTGALNGSRAGHTATLLPDGRVLIAGGVGNPDVFPSAELYDPASGIFTATGAMIAIRSAHTATLLPNGKVLVAGGLGAPDVASGPQPALSSAELYDPASGTFTATGSMTTARDSFTATLLPNQKVLIAGGANAAGSLSSAELYY